MKRYGLVRLGTALLLVNVALNQPAALLAQQAPGATSASRPSAALSTGSVAGAAWKGDTTPFPHARIRLRDVVMGRSVARTVADADGRFRFDEVQPGAYAVELLSNDDKVLAVGELFSVIAGKQALTSVRLTSRAPWFGGFFGNAAAAVIAAASTLGVTATGSDGRPVSPQ